MAWICRERSAVLLSACLTIGVFELGNSQRSRSLNLVRFPRRAGGFTIQAVLNLAQAATTEQLLHPGNGLMETQAAQPANLKMFFLCSGLQPGRVVQVCRLQAEKDKRFFFFHQQPDGLLAEFPSCLEENQIAIFQGILESGEISDPTQAGQLVEVASRLLRTFIMKKKGCTG